MKDTPKFRSVRCRDGAGIRGAGEGTTEGDKGARSAINRLDKAKYPGADRERERILPSRSKAVSLRSVHRRARASTRLPQSRQGLPTSPARRILCGRAVDPYPSS